jgi:putative DNA primase/helicase
MADSPIIFTPGEISAYYAVRMPQLKRRRAPEWRGPCPIHKGERDSFAVKSATGQWCCHSTCGRGGDICGLEMALTGADFKTAKAAIFRIVGRADPLSGNGAARPRIAATYDYTDETGQVLYQSVRMEPKGFKQRKPDGKGGWLWNIKGVRLVLYRLPDLLRRGAETVFICEGEKDGHSLESLGLLATCNPMGAGKWKSEYAETLRGRSVVLLPDNDPPKDEDGNPHYKGQKHAGSVAADLLRVGCEVRIVEVPEGKDVSDWLGAGGTLEKLHGLVNAQPALTKDALVVWRARWEPDAGAAAEISAKPRKTGGPESSAFRLTDDGVIYIDPTPENEPLRICGRLEVAAFTRDAKGDGWGRLLRWRDAEGRAHEWAMPMSLLSGDGGEYRARLLDGGLFIAPGRKVWGLLAVYLQTARSESRALCVPRVGWHKDSFVLPGATIGPEGAEPIIFQTPFEAEHGLSVSGTVDDWRNHIGRFCSGNSRLILAVSCGFAGPLLSLMGGESGGVHFVGATSTGKSTALMVGGSVLGGGGRNGFVQSWRATANGLEAIAELHNDLTLFLDELAQFDAREAAETAYLLGNGSGKARMSRNIGARKKLSWALLFVSAGEVTLADHAQTAGKRTKGGAEVRLLNIEADARARLGLFEDIHGAASPDLFARQLKEAAGRYYGAPLRAYLEFIAAKRAEVESTVRNFQMDFMKNRVPAGAAGEVFRAAQRFAVIAAAGELATGARITGWERGQATAAAARCFKVWLDARGTAGAGDIEAAINQVRQFIGAHGASRFQSTKPRHDHQGDIIHERVINRAGFRVEGEDGEVSEYLILPEIFRGEVCAGFNYLAVARALWQRGHLDCEPPHLTKKPRLPELGLTRVYAIKSSILGE